MEKHSELNSCLDTILIFHSKSSGKYKVADANYFGDYIAINVALANKRATPFLSVFLLCLIFFLRLIVYKYIKFLYII